MDTELASAAGGWDVPPELIERLDQACDRFEADLRAGERPRIEGELAAIPDAGRPALLRELLGIGLAYGRCRGERPDPGGVSPALPRARRAATARSSARRPLPTQPRADQPRCAETAAAGADRNLLFGILAMQLDFISRDQLVAAMNAWALDKRKPLGRILADRGALAEARLSLLEALVQEHLEQHGGDPERSLASPQPRSARLAATSRRSTTPNSRPPSPTSPPAQHDDDPAATRPHAAGVPTSAGARFRVIRPHASGGLGEVFVARDEELHRDVALKEIRAPYAGHPESRSRFVLEAEVTGALEHPGIIPVYGLGTYADGRPFYAMRFIRGDSLKQAIDRFHGAEATRTRPGPAVAGVAEAAGPVRRRLQRDRLRTQPGRAPPRPEAGQHPAGPVWRDAGGRLGAGQGDRTARGGGRRRGDVATRVGERVERDAAGLGAGDAGVHEPGAGGRRPGPARPGQRRLQPGGDALLPPDRQAALRGGRPHRGDPGRAAWASSRRLASSIPRSTGRWRRSASRRWPSSPRTATPRPGSGRRPRAVDGRRARHGLARAAGGPGPTLDGPAP